MANLEDLLARCNRYGLTVMLILFDGCFGECPVTQGGGVCTTDGTVPFPDYVAAVLGFATPPEALPPRLDRFRIADILQHTDTRPTTPENFAERRNALFETGRCLMWAGVKHESDFQQAVTECTRAVELHAAGKLEEACRQMEAGHPTAGQGAPRHGNLRRDA